MSAVTLAVQMENDYLGFDFAEEMVAEARVGDIVTLSYDFGAGPRRIVGTYQGRETRDSGEVFVWVREHDATKTRYAIPMGMVEGLRVEMRAEHVPETDGNDYADCEVCGDPIDHCQGHGEIAETVSSGRSSRGRARAHRTVAGETPAAFGRSCARIDYEGTAL